MLENKTMNANKALSKVAPDLLLLVINRVKERCINYYLDKYGLSSPDKSLRKAMKKAKTRWTDHLTDKERDVLVQGGVIEN